MAASTSMQPHGTPEPTRAIQQKVKKSKSSFNKGKGKEKEDHPAIEPHTDGELPGATDAITGEKNDTRAWKWTFLTDGFSRRVPPVFSNDGKYYFVLIGSSVKIHSVATGKVVSTLTAPPRTKPRANADILTSAIINPHNSFQLITSSLDGRLQTWDFTDATLLQTIDIEQPIHFLCAHKELKDVVFVIVSKGRTGKTEDDADTIVLQVSTKIPVNSQGKKVKLVGRTRSPTGLALSPSGCWLVASAGHTVYVAKTTDLAAGFTKYVSPERLTCLAFHPFEEYFATGDDKGYIRIWYCLNENLAAKAVGVEKRSQTSSFHWHAHAVSCVAFSSNGAYLLSGGEEAVLVIWQLHSGKKEFMPRLGAPISTISVLRTPQQEEYLVGLEDSTFMFISSGSLSISRYYAHIKISPPVPNESISTSKILPAPLAMHSLSSTLILPSSHPSSIQIYSPSTGTLVSELEISPSNRVSRRDEKPVEPVRVAWVVISSNGKWMATIDTRQGDGGFRGEVYLKIWAWERKTSSWTLNTRIDRPHGLWKITDMQFSPSHDGRLLNLATSGDDGSVKIWGLRERKKKGGEDEEFWVARKTFDFRSEIPRSTSWSPDASLLAVSFGLYVVLYDSSTFLICHIITIPELRLTESVHFVGPTGRFLLLKGSRTLVLWDLVSHSVRWCYRFPVAIVSVIPQPHGEKIFAFAPVPNLGKVETRIFVFCISSRFPTGFHIPFELRSIAYYPFSHNSAGSAFAGIAQDWSIVIFGDYLPTLNEEGSNANGVSAEVNRKQSLFQSIFGHTSFESNPVAPVTSSSLVQSKANDILRIFEAPAYLMPPVGMLYDPLLGSLLKPRPVTVPLPIETHADNKEDVEMDEESADPVVLETHKRREVSEDELRTLVDLFRRHSVHAGVQPTRASQHPRVNGKANGVAHPRSPTHDTSQSPAKQNGIKGVVPHQIEGKARPTLTPEDELVHSQMQQDSSPPMTGKKRKKSLG